MSKSPQEIEALVADLTALGISRPEAESALQRTDYDTARAADLGEQSHYISRLQQRTHPFDLIACILEGRWWVLDVLACFLVFILFSSWLCINLQS